MDRCIQEPKDLGEVDEASVPFPHKAGDKTGPGPEAGAPTPL